MTDYYKTLGIEYNASQKLINQQGRTLLYNNHPFVSGKAATGQQFRLVYEALVVLTDNNLRGEYDHTLDGALEQNIVATTEPGIGALRNRVLSAAREAEMLEKDYLLFADKFLNNEDPVEEKKPTSRSSGAGDLFIRLGFMLLISGICFLVLPMKAGDGPKPAFFYVFGPISIIGGALLLYRGIKKSRG